MIMVIFENLMRSNLKLGKLSFQRLISMDEVKFSSVRVNFTWMLVSDLGMYQKVETGERLSLRRKTISSKTRTFLSR